MVTRIALLPGVSLTAVQTDKFKTACFSICFLRPLRRREAAMNALIPDVLLRGSAAAPSIRAVADRLDTLYGACAGSLVRKAGETQLTGLFFDCLDDRFADEPLFGQLLDFAAELLFCPQTKNGVFLPELVAQERRSLRDAMRSALDDKAEFCEAQLLRAMCPDEGYALSRLGAPDTLDAIDEQTLWAHYQDVLASSRAELFYLGSKPAAQVADLLLPHLARLPRGRRAQLPAPPAAALPAAVRRVKEALPLAQSRLCMGFRTGVNLHDDAYPAMLLCNALLGGGEQNRLYCTLRGRLCLCYDAGSWYDGYKGILAASAGCGAADLPAVEAEILNQLSQLASGAFSHQELESARAGLLSDLRALHDSPERLEAFYTGRAAAGVLQSPQALADALACVSQQDVLCAAQRICLDTVCCLEGNADADD